MLYIGSLPAESASAIYRLDIDSGNSTEIYRFSAQYAPNNIALLQGSLLFTESSEGLFLLSRNGTAEAQPISTGLEDCTGFNSLLVVNGTYFCFLNLKV